LVSEPPGVGKEMSHYLNTNYNLDRQIYELETLLSVNWNGKEPNYDLCLPNINLSQVGSFNVLIYMHRYTPDTLSSILNGYLREFMGKIQVYRNQQEHNLLNGSSVEQNKARKEMDKLDLILAECRQYEADILYPLAGERIAIDLDDGVLVNYNKFGAAITQIDGLNDKKTKKKVLEFDWIDTTQIR
jgi:hypothetical protein